METPDYFANVIGAIEGLREAAKIFLDDADTPAEALALAFDNLADDIAEDDEPLLTLDQLAALRTACGIDKSLPVAGNKHTAISPARLVEIRADARDYIPRFIDPTVIRQCGQILDRRGEAWAAEILGRDISRRSLGVPNRPFLTDAEPYVLIVADTDEDRARFDQIIDNGPKAD